MQADLLRRMRKSREFTVDIGKFKFTVLRPTNTDMYEAGQTGMTPIEFARKFVVGWSGVTEADVVPQGTTDTLEFDADVWSAWLDDHPEFWGPIGDGIIAAFQKHKDRQEAAEKK